MTEVENDDTLVAVDVNDEDDEDDEDEEDEEGDEASTACSDYTYNDSTDEEEDLGDKAEEDGDSDKNNNDDDDDDNKDNDSPTVIDGLAGQIQEAICDIDYLEYDIRTLEIRLEELTKRKQSINGVLEYIHPVGFDDHVDVDTTMLDLWGKERDRISHQKEGLRLERRRLFDTRKKLLQGVGELCAQEEVLMDLQTKMIAKRMQQQQDVNELRAKQQLQIDKKKKETTHVNELRGSSTQKNTQLNVPSPQESMNRRTHNDGTMTEEKDNIVVATDVEDDDDEVLNAGSISAVVADYKSNHWNLDDSNDDDDDDDDDGVDYSSGLARLDLAIDRVVDQIMGSQRRIRKLDGEICTLEERLAILVQREQSLQSLLERKCVSESCLDDVHASMIVRWSDEQGKVLLEKKELTAKSNELSNSKMHLELELLKLSAKKRALTEKKTKKKKKLRLARQAVREEQEQHTNMMQQLNLIEDKILVVKGMVERAHAIAGSAGQPTKGPTNGPPLSPATVLHPIDGDLTRCCPQSSSPRDATIDHHEGDDRQDATSSQDKVVSSSLGDFELL